MAVLKTEGWPTVLPNDDGIRPAGRPDECFYCHRRVGQLHGSECVFVMSVNRYFVYMNLDRRASEAHKGKLVGTFTRHDPHFWSAHDCEFHKNSSSWCANNAEGLIEWSDPADEAALRAWVEVNNGCWCTPLYFEFDDTVDGGPFQEVRDG